MPLKHEGDENHEAAKNARSQHSLFGDPRHPGILHFDLVARFIRS
jgi:hypothetical protein